MGKVPLELIETQLPGVGVRYSFTTAQGGRIAIVQHEEGRSELYYFAGPDREEPTVVIRLEPHEARQAGSIMSGAYERPRIVEELEIAFGELVIEWIHVPDDSPLVGRTIAESAVRKRTGITVIAILREPHPVAAAQPEDEIRKGDTLVTVGRPEQYPRFRQLFVKTPRAS